MQTASAASGGSYLYGSSPDDTLTLYFSGPTIEVVYVEGTALGILVIEVDGTVLRSVITTTESTQFGRRAKIDYLTDEAHTLRVYASHGIIGIDAFYTEPTEASSIIDESLSILANENSERFPCNLQSSQIHLVSVGPFSQQGNRITREGL